MSHSRISLVVCTNRTEVIEFACSFVLIRFEWRPFHPRSCVSFGFDRCFLQVEKIQNKNYNKKKIKETNRKTVETDALGPKNCNIITARVGGLQLMLKTLTGVSFRASRFSISHFYVSPNWV